MAEARRQDDEFAPRLADWPLRPWLTGGLLALCGLAIFFFTDGGQETPWRMAGAAFFAFGGIAAAFTLDKGDWKAPAIFALIVAVVMAGIAFNVTDSGDRVGGEEYNFFAGVFAAGLAVPLFQAGFHRTRLRTDYRETHYYVWTDAVSGGGALAFTGLSWLVLVLLDQLFRLIDIEIIGDLLEEDWFGWTFSGAAFGAALGVLRNQLKVLGTLQWVVLLVFSLLAVPLAIALVLFLIPLAASGGQVLWDATRSPTPILLSCAAGAFILVNSVIRDSDTHRSQNRIMQVAAALLAFGVFPLTVFAAISMGTRIAQYGLAPERIWGLIAIAVAVVYGVAYWAGLVRGRVAGWAEQLRRSNLYLAVAVCALALFLALPIVNFGAISTSDQIARLESGAVSADDFDYDALRWDFGKPGRDALARLAKSEDGAVAELAQEALDRVSRPWRGMENQTTAAERLAKARFDIGDPDLRAAAEKYVRGEEWRCSETCTIIDLGTRTERGTPHLVFVEGENVQHLTRNAEGDLVDIYPGFNCVQPTEAGTAQGGVAVEVGTNGCRLAGEIDPEGPVEVRPYAGRQVYVDGRPVGQPFQ